jgi:hypothetical protein
MDGLLALTPRNSAEVLYPKAQGTTARVSLPALSLAQQCHDQDVFLRGQPSEKGASVDACMLIIVDKRRSGIPLF